MEQIQFFLFNNYDPKRSKLQNPNNMEVRFTAHFRNLISTGQYQFRGYLGRIPIDGNGRFNLTYSKVKFIL